MTLNKDQELVAFFVDRCEGPCGRTRLMKLFYMADYEARRLMGRPISNLQYKWHFYGPFDQQVYDHVDALVTSGVVLEQPIEYPGGKRGSLYTRGAAAVQPTLTPAEMQILAYVTRQYSQTPLRELLDDIVYQTEPMLDAQENNRKGQLLQMDMVNNTRAQELGVSFEEILDRSRRVKAGEYLTHEQAMKSVTDQLAEADAGTT